MRVSKNKNSFKKERLIVRKRKGGNKERLSKRKSE